jgi:hypothetical protein
MRTAFTWFSSILSVAVRDRVSDPASRPGPGGHFMPDICRVKPTGIQPSGIHRAPQLTSTDV